MTTFAFAPRVGEHDHISTALGASPSAKFVDADIGKAVKLGPNHNYIPVAAGDELEGIVEAIAPHTVNGGYSFGTVQKGGYQYAVTDNATCVVGDTMVAGAQAALGTVNNANKDPVVRKGTPTKFLWRVVDLLTGAGAIGTRIVIEKI